ncbi:hypothetical protein SH449x_002545 [Pirellulaceae bacterium SH449]
MDFEEGVGASKLYELRFSDWPVGDENKMTYRIDPESFVIREIEGFFGGTRAKLEVLEFTNFKDVPFPKRTKLTNKQPSGETLVKQCEWNESTVESVGFVQEQLYLPFYGLSHPDLGELPEEKPSWTYVYVVVGFLFLVAAWLISKKYRN